MTDYEPTSARDLPIACSVLHNFDAEALQALAALDAPAVRALLAGADVAPLAPGAERYQLMPGARAVLLERLRREQPRDERVLHRMAFNYYLQRLAADPHQPDPLDEAAALHHLRTLRELNLDYMQWGEVDTLIEALREIGPLQPQHADELTLYTAANAMRAQQYGQSEALLRGLLDRADVVADLRAGAWNTLGILAMVQGLFERAIACFEATLDVTGTVNPSQYGSALVNLSWVYHQLNQFDTALDLGRRSLAHFRAAADLYGEAFALYTIGNNALYLGRWPLAQEHLDRATAIYAAAGMDARSGMVDWARGLLYQILGDNARGEAAYLSALRSAEAPDYANPITARDTLEMLGLLYHSQGRLDDAAAAYTRAITLGERVGDEHRRAQSLHRLGALQLQQGWLDAALATLRAAIDGVEQIRASTEGEEIKIGLLGTVQQIYESIVLACLRCDDRVSAFGYVERARARAFLDMLARNDAALAAGLAERPVTLAGAQALLDGGALLLEYYTLGVMPAGAHFLDKIPAENTGLREQLLSAPEIILFAITSDGLEVHRIAFDPNRLQPPPGDPTPGRHLLTERKLRWLYTQLLAPVEHLIAGRRILHIVPHGPLHYVPFAALQRPDGRCLLGADGPCATYAPSATVLRACLERRPSGDVDMALGYNGAGLSMLRLAEHEARQIVELSGGTAVAGSQVKSQRLFELAARLRRLHIAGHAVFLSDNPLGSYLLLGAGDHLDARTMMHSLKLNATLVTLNACTSGLSHVASGDELLGLPRALLYAGASTIVCALHEVDDLAAYILMVHFYQNLADRQPAAAALHHAQLTLQTLHRDEVAAVIQGVAHDDKRVMLASLDDYDSVPFAHPRYWAPFMVIGKP